MYKIYKINTFQSITFDEQKKPIVICDIDNTFICPKYNYKYYYDNIKNGHFNSDELDDLIKNMLSLSISTGLIKHTDYEGFSKMLQRIKQLGGKLIFLTARGHLTHENTMKQLQNVGLHNPENYEIHYTNNKITKGDYIKKYNLLDGYNHFSFIDDYEHCIDSVVKNFPNVNCYLFEYK